MAKASVNISAKAREQKGSRANKRLRDTGRLLPEGSK